MLVHSLQSEGFTNDIDGLGNGRVVSLEEIGAALEAWDAPEPLPMPESYDDIRAEAEADSASGFTSDEEAEAAATAAGLDAVLPDASSAAMEINFPNLNGDDEEEEEVDDEEWSAESDAALLAREFPGLHPNKQRVWVLCGGEGPQRDESLRAAVHAMECLQGAPDLLIETFFMDPPDAGSAYVFLLSTFFFIFFLSGSRPGTGMSSAIGFLIHTLAWIPCQFLFLQGY